jgi:hypothetical protein
MTNNFEQNIKSPENNEQISREFAIAMEKLAENGDPYYLIKFVRKNNSILPYNIDISGITKSNFEKGINFSLRRLTVEDFNFPLKIWGLLKTVGALTEIDLGYYIKSYIEDYMMLTDEEIEKIKSTSGMSMTKYNPEFIARFTEEVKSKIKASLGWNVSINLKHKDF